MWHGREGKCENAIKYQLLGQTLKTKSKYPWGRFSQCSSLAVFAQSGRGIPHVFA
jgi:hypothetical protein